MQLNMDDVNSIICLYIKVSEGGRRTQRHKHRDTQNREERGARQDP